MSFESWDPWRSSASEVSEIQSSVAAVSTQFGLTNYQDIATQEQIPEERYNLISVLSLIQDLGLNVLPITWLEALGPLGSGATAEVRQALVNIETSFAFKRFTLVTSDAYRALYSEISILAHPIIRCHQNIVSVEGICWDISPDSSAVWPVLVFRKSNCGDLMQFMQSEDGKALSIPNALSILRDIANGIACLHMNGP
jgi:serine/threonine protein kinase